MATFDYNGSSVEVDADGCLTNTADWDEEFAKAVAKEEGIELNDRHWLVIKFLQDQYEATGQVPTIRAIKNDSGVDTKELYQLFPKGPVKKASRISGLPKPKSCI